MEDSKIRIGITQGDINGVGYEVILKTFSDPTMLELCTPIIYGSPKVAAYHRKALDIQTNFSIINTASEAGYNRLSVLNCTDDEVKVEFSKPDPEAGKAALGGLERAIEDYREGLIDVIVTAPINKHTIHSEEFSFPISVNSPIARGLIGKEEDDVVVIKTPGGEVEFEVIKVEYL